MKKVDIPLVKRKDNSNDINSLINEANKLLNKNEFSLIDVNRIYNKCKHDIELTREELIYIYDIYANRRISNSDNNLDIIEDIKKMRKDIVKDYMIIFNCKRNQIASNIDELLAINPANCVVYLNDINNYIDWIYGKKLSNLRYVKGYLELHPNQERTNYKYLTSLEVIDSAAIFKYIKSSEGLYNLKVIGTTADFSELMDASGLTSLNYIGGTAWFSRLKSANGLNNLRYIGEYDHFEGLYSLGKESFNNLESLEYVGSNICIPKEKIKTLKR